MTTATKKTAKKATAAKAHAEDVDAIERSETSPVGKPMGTVEPAPMPEGSVTLFKVTDGDGGEAVVVPPSE